MNESSEAFRRLNHFILPASLIAFAMLISLCNVSSGQDWPSRNGEKQNRVVATDKQVVDFDIDEGGNAIKTSDIKWSVKIGMGLESEPAISDGLVWVGGSNNPPRDPNVKGDAGVLFCFRESDGKFLYQHVSPRRKEGRDFDWPGYGIASTPFIEKDRLYFCTNRCETICLDIGPLLDGTGMPKEVWKVDMVERFGVHPGAAHIGSRHLHCSPAVWSDYVYVNTTHTVQEHQKADLPKDSAPAPSLICFDKKTGEVKWSDNTPGDIMLGPQWNNPTIIQVNGRAQVVMGQGDGWVRSFDCLTGELIWKFDINEKLARVKFQNEPFRRHLRQVIAEPVYCNGRLFFSAGYEHEFSDITGRLCCIDPIKKGDLSSELISADNTIIANPNSGLIWEFTGSSSGRKGVDADRENPNVMRDSFGSVVVKDGLVVAVDLLGSVHCLDEKTGKRHWSYDTMGDIWGSPLILDNWIVVVNEDCVFCIPLSDKLDAKQIRKNETPLFLHSSPVFANGTLFSTDYSKLYAIPARAPEKADK